MRTTVRRAAGKLADTVREMHEAQQLLLVLLVLHTAADRYVEASHLAGRAPATRYYQT
jgi:hypothetical protein